MNILGFPKGRSLNSRSWVSQGQIVSVVSWKGLGSIHRDNHSRFLNDKGNAVFRHCQGKIQWNRGGEMEGECLRPFKPKCESG